MLALISRHMLTMVGYLDQRQSYPSILYTTSGGLAEAHPKEPAAACSQQPAAVHGCQ